MSTATRHLDASTVKAAASGRWVEILAAVGGVDRAILDGRHHPCPKCGGVDRFRMIDAAAGAVYCNQCFSSGNGDGVAAIGWLRGCDFPTALRLVAEYLNLTGAGNGRPASEKSTKPRATYPTASAAIADLERRHGKSTARWTYHDQDGAPVGVVVRWDLPDGRKDIRPVSLVDGGWAICGMPTPRPLYGLVGLTAVQRVYVTEGEKAADAARSIGLVATTSSNGCKSPAKADWTPLAGTEVIILPDNDDAGRGYASTVEGILRALDPPARVRRVELPGLPPAGDIYDWLDQRDAVDPDDLRAEVEHLADAATASDTKPERFPAVTCAELAAGTYTTEYYVEGVCVAQQPHLLGGPSKSLKTSIAWDWAISVVTGCPFLGHEDFAVARQGRVAFFSGEGGLGFLQDVGRRVCAAKQLRLEDIGDRMVVCDRIPRLDRHVDLDALGEFLAKYKTDLAFFDPCYLALGGADAGNVLAMGERLGAVNEICIKTKSTPVFLHHLKRGRVDPYAPADLGDLAWSGFAEFAGSWLLLSRREPYLATGHALHKLWLVCGGRTGHGSLHGLDVAEGTSGSEEGRYWAPRVFTPDQVDAQRQQAADGAKATRRQEQIEADRREIVEVITKIGRSETKNGLRDRTSCGYRRFDMAFASLVGDGMVKSATVTRANGHEYEGWELANETE